MHNRASFRRRWLFPDQVAQYLKHLLKDGVELNELLLQHFRVGIGAPTFHATTDRGAWFGPKGQCAAFQSMRRFRAWSLMLIVPTSVN